jgi:transposase-like protein
MAENAKKVSPEQVVRAIRRQTRRKFSADEKIRIVLEGLKARPASRICAAARASIPTSTTPGAKNFWRRASGG